MNGLIINSFSACMLRQPYLGMFPASLTFPSSLLVTEINWLWSSNISKIVFLPEGKSLKIFLSKVFPFGKKCIYEI